MKTYTVNEIFYSLQGEGMRSGTANVFVRLTGCNLECAIEPGEKSPGGFDCDTEFASGTKMEGVKLLEHCTQIGGKCKSVIFTGGEPGLQLAGPLVELFMEAGWYTAIETNGSIDVGELGCDWITVSPKVAEHAVRQVWADEVKYVRGYLQAIPKPTCKATHQIISPAFNGLEKNQDAIQWFIELVKDNPDWRLSVQDHKLWQVR